MGYMMPSIHIGPVWDEFQLLFVVELEAKKITILMGKH